MSGRIARYAVLNAKLRTRLGRLLPEDLFASISRAQSPEAARILLSDTPYQNLTGTIEEMEAELLAMEIRDLRGILPLLSGRVLATGEAFLFRYETEIIKRALRMVFSRQILLTEPREPHLEPCLDLFPRLPLRDLLQCANFDDAAETLSGTVHAPAVIEKKAEVLGSGSIYAMEIDLDRLFYSQLLRTIEQLPGKDRDIARRMVGVEIDIQNISWICRLTGFYAVIPSLLEGLLIPGGFKTEPTSLIEASESGPPIESMGSYLGDLYPGFDTLLKGGKKDLVDRLSLFESVLEAILDREIRHILLGNPFTIGILPAYTILKRREIRKLVSALNTASYGDTAERSAGSL